MGQVPGTQPGIARTEQRGLIHLRPGVLACLMGVIAGVGLFWAFQPRNCVGVPNDPGMDPSGFTKECDTRVDVHLSLPYKSDSSEPGTYSAHSGPTSANNGPVAFFAVIGGLGSAAIVGVILGWREHRTRDRLPPS